MVAIFLHFGALEPDKNPAPGESVRVYHKPAGIPMENMRPPNSP